MLEALLEALLWLIGQVLRAAVWFVGELVFGFLGYATARFLVPVLTFGTARVEDGPFQIPGLWKRTSRGLVLGGNFAAFLGIVFWVAALALIGLGLASRGT